MPKNYEKAAEWYRKAADQGDTLAKESVDKLYRNGKISSNYNIETTKEAKTSTNQDSGLDEFKTASKYLRGEGVLQDYVKAAEWYEKAADQGNASAQFNLAVMYHKGQGVSQNDRIARSYFSKACNNGHKASCRNYQKLK